MEHGADSSARNSQYGTPAMGAMAFGHLECLRIVLKYTAKGLARKELDREPSDNELATFFRKAVNDNIAGLSSAIENKQRNVVDYILDFNDINVNVNLYPEKRSLLAFAVESEMEDVVVKLLAKGANVNGGYNNLKITLLQAAARGDRQAWKSFHKGDSNLKSPLMFAAEKGNLNIMKVLYEKGADIDLTGPSKHFLQYHERESHCHLSAVYFAAREGHFDCLKFLLDRRPDAKALLNPGYIAMLETMCNGYAECIELLLESGLDPNERHSWTGLCHFPLSKACEMGYVDCVKTLIKHGANVNNNDKHGPALEYCARYKQYNMIDILLEAGSSVNNSPGTQSVLWLAVQHGDLDVVKQLLEKGADTNVPCVMGETPLFIAADLGHTECLKAILSQKDTMVNVLNHHGCTAIIGAIRNQKLDSVSILLKHGLDPNLCQPIGDKYSRSEGNLYPLMWAIKEDYPSCVNFLLTHGADPSMVSVYGLNSYQYAVSQDRPDSLRALLEHDSAKCLFKTQSKQKSLLQKLKDFKKIGLRKKKHTVGINDLLIESMNTYPRTSSECAKVLLSCGADVNYRNKRNMSSLDFAAERLMMNHAKLLLENNADISYKPRPFRSLISHIGTEGVMGQKFSDVSEPCVGMKMLLLAAGCEMNHKYQQIPEELEEFSDILAHEKTTLTLQRWCRKSIRKHLTGTHGGNLFCLIPQLPIPKAIMKFLLYGQVLKQKEHVKLNIQLSGNSDCVTTACSDYSFLPTRIENY